MENSVRLIINADDLGLTRGINSAIFKAHTDGFLSHASIMTNASWYKHAVEEVVQKCPQLKVGVHLNITCEKSLSKGTLLCNFEGEMKSSFIRLLFKPKTRNLLAQVEGEFEAQIKAAKHNGIEISHLDGHEHIHIIPSFNKIVRKLAKKYDIDRIREINESFLSGIISNRQSVTSANILKWTLLKFLSFFNENEGVVRFHSIFSTCRINSDNLAKALKKNENAKFLEIMVHPGLREHIEDGAHLDKRFRDFLNSPDRLVEYKVCFDQKLKEYEVAK